MGRPKALLTDRRGRPLVDVAVDRLITAGCTGVTVVLGADADQVHGLLRHRTDGRCRVVEAGDWSEGMGASLRRGLDALDEAAQEGSAGDVGAALVTLVDLPDVDEAVMARVLEQWGTAGGRQDALVRATYRGVPGHPVLIGRDHWAPLGGALSGDRGAQQYLRRHRVLEVSCEDLATGRDVDRPEDLG